nr:AraC family transcriptional regulator [Paenibacillus caui]
MSYRTFIHQSIDYIERHLDESIELERVAAHVGFSMFHFHRIFRREVGMTVADYVRTRRLCRAP